MESMVLHRHDDNTITIQRADYIEDGGYISIVGNEISVWEIPQFGGTEQLIGKYSTLIEALDKLNTLT